VDLVRLEAGWTAAESRDAVQGWLRVAIRGGMRLGLVGGQNDLIATGAIEALEAAAAEQGRPELVSTPVIGCDGTPGLGQRLVKEGKLKATVVLPCWTGPAVDTIAGVLSTGKLPRPLVSVVGAAFPPEEQIRGG